MENAARTESKRHAERGFVEERDNLENHDIGWRVILKWISRKQADGSWTGLMWLRTGTRGETRL